MFELSKQSQDFVTVSGDGYRLTFAAFSKAWIPALLGSIVLLAPTIVTHLLLSDSSSEQTEQSSWKLWVFFTTFVFYPALMASVLLIVHGVAQGHAVSLKQALGRGVRCSIPNTIGAVLFIAFVSIGSVLLFLPGIFLFFSLSFWWFGVVIEREPVLTAFRSSFKLVRGTWWRTAFVLVGCYALPIVFFNAPESLVKVLPAAHFEHTLVAAFAVIFMLVFTLLVVVIAPILISAFMVVQFNDLKCRASARIATTNNTALAPLNTSKPAATSATSNPDAGTARRSCMEYASFWRRLGAYFLDVIIILPVAGLVLWMGDTSRLSQVYFFLPGILFNIWFYVYLVKRYGGTPGKLILKIRIAKLDGEPVGYREAVLRYSVLFFLSVASSIAILIATINMSDAEYLSLGFQARAIKLTEQAPSWYSVVHILLNIWIWSEFISMLTNKRRRAIHDFMAGTVVVRKTTAPVKRGE